ncbi:MAG: hypothetical protein V4621_08200 [Pseudomonadota bacterium]
MASGSPLSKNKQARERWKELVAVVSQAHTVDPDESFTSKAARVNRALVDYDFFVTTYFPHYTKDKTGRVTNCAPFHIKAANQILSDPYFTGLLAWFRGSAKSTHANIFLPLWLKIQRPIRQLNVMMLIGKNAKTAARLLQDIQVELAKNDLYINDFGHQMKAGSWEEGEFQTEDGCAFVSLGMGQPPRGTRFGANRPDYIVMDDFDDDKMKKNAARVREVIEWIHRAVLPTMDIGVARFIAVNNLIAKKGVMAGLRAEHPDWYWDQVDALDKQGNPTWDKYTKEYFDRLLAKVKRKAFLSEYMNDPQEDGGVFTNEQVIFKKMPNNWTDFDALVMYADPSFSTSETSDFFSIPLWAKKGAQFYKLKVYHRQRETSAKAIKWWFDFYLKMPQAIRSKLRCYVEANATQKELLRPVIQKEAKKRGIASFIRYDTRKKGDKEDRISSMTTQYENGDVFYNVDEQNDPDMMASVEMLTSWTEGAKHDDGPDADESAWRMLEKLGRKSGRGETRSGSFQKSSNRSF